MLVVAKYPKIRISLVGIDGNAFSVLGHCTNIARKAGLTSGQVNEFHEEAISGNYNHLIQTCMSYFDISLR